MWKNFYTRIKKYIKNAYLVVSTDSGPMHISAVSGTPTIGIFGPTNWVNSAPYGEWSIAIYDKEYFRDGIPFQSNSKVIDNYFEHIDINNGLEKISKYL